MKRTYFADFNFSGDFEIIFNGISIKRNKLNGVSNGLEYLNPYISRSGQQNITLSIKPLNKGNKISIQDAKDYFIDIIYTNNGEPSPIHNVMRCSFPPISQPVDSLVYTWNFDADVPFEINTLSNAKDLTQENPEKLLQEVIKKYQGVHKLINSGNVEEYMTIYKKSREREMISMYYDDIKQKEYLAGLENRVLLSKGFMQPLNDFQLLIHPNKKIVSLVNSQGKTPLYSIDDNKRIKTYGLQLYRSIKTGKLEVY
ncbi:hypothetical protein O2K51_08425 [Apibacter raozihei]|uniref:hypothetical protein n=1 Tax=Apibacter raozihei TaxID=2500547 RepID=UPI000FE32DE2|nr:hypothetical protein [Apibacter raozihei]